MLSFLVFSALGLFYYSSAADGSVPISLYTPVRITDELSITAMLMFRSLHIFASIFLLLSGFTVFGIPVSLLFIASDAFVIGFSLQYSMSYLLDKASLAYVFSYFLCISLFAMLDMLLCCEVIRYSRYACGGTKEMLGARRMAGYIASFLTIIIFDIFISYILALISV